MEPLRSRRRHLDIFYFVGTNKSLKSLELGNVAGLHVSNLARAENRARWLDVCKIVDVKAPSFVDASLLFSTILRTLGT